MTRESGSRQSGTREAVTDHPVHELIAKRWSPCGFDSAPVDRETILSLFEAARWAPSSYNEQPWGMIAAMRGDTGEHERLLSCLVEANRTWARAAPVLALMVARMTFARNGKPNRHAFHDVGLAAANLTVEATARGLCVHQMAGILPERARELYAIPADHEPVTALAIGRAAADLDALPEEIRARDTAPRTRRPLSGSLFSGSWGHVSTLLEPAD